MVNDAGSFNSLQKTKEKKQKTQHLNIDLAFICYHKGYFNVSDEFLEDLGHLVSDTQLWQ